MFVANKKPGATRDELRGIKQASGGTIKAVAYEIMEQAYMKASANNTLPANARQIMYAARPTILARLNLPSLEDETFFKVLTKYLIEKKEETRTGTWCTTPEDTSLSPTFGQVWVWERSK